MGENIAARGQQIEALCKDYFSICDVQFQFWGSAEILNSYRETPNYSLSLIYQECLTQDEQYVLLVRLSDYHDFITNKEGKLRKYLFDSNVRDFMGLTSVNEDILDTLEHETDADFWWLNNGVTILSTGATIVGKSISIRNVQIVNGLQTSECLYRHFKHSSKQDNRYLLIKVLTSQDTGVRDTIIRATNNQTKVETASLHATDKIQRDIEDILKKSGLYYERRINYYSNQGIPNEKIFSPLYLAAGYTALVLKLPHKAVSLKNRFMRQPLQYEKIFSETTDLNVWPVIAHLLRQTDGELASVRPKNKSNMENYLRSVRYVVCLVTLGRIMGKYDFSVQELIDFDLNSYTNELIASTWTSIQEFIPEIWNKTKWRNKTFTMDVINFASTQFSIANFASISKRNDSLFEEKRFKVYKLDEEFLQQIRACLPPQPWPVGTHRNIAIALSAPPAKVSQGINQLVEQNEYYRQKDGKLYDEDGNEILLDINGV